MRILSKYFKLFLVFCVFASCTHCKQSVIVSDKIHADTINNQLITFDLSEFPDTSTVKLSTIGAREIMYIPLETTPNNGIFMIQYIDFSNNYFLVTEISNNYSLCMFQNDGSFITKVGTLGDGTNEFSAISDVDINPVDESIYIANVEHNNFLVYNKNGEFIRTINSPAKKFKIPNNGLMRFKFSNEGILCYYGNFSGDIEDSYILFDTTGNIIKKFPNKYPWKRIKPGVGYSGENLFYVFNNQLYKKEIYCDTIFAFKNKAFEPHLIIDVGNQRITPDVRTKIRTRSEASSVLKTFINPWNLFEFGDLIYYEMAVTIDGVHDLFSFIGSKKDNFKALILASEGLINDIDGGPNFWPKTIENDSTLVSWIDAIQFKKYIASDTFKNAKPRYAEKKKELEKLANKLKETDNPVLMMVRIKN